ncbi:serine/threonine-protein kinase pim-2 [Lates calcarifer]|uniref:non-specific serine/threonine protein kinase n=1 Tax=Lates calcarifer TaxID=8187 RepID=A0A4W6BKZ5_LATCA|nr:serine/threonine-protein kinase pim-2 [Lates calcarifer]
MRRKRDRGTTAALPPQRMRGHPHPPFPTSAHGAEGRTSTKRKSDEAQEPRKRSRKTCRRSESDSPPVTAEASTSEKPSTSSTSLPEQAPKPGSRAAFEAKYKQEKLLGEGGYGSVYAGHRRDDGLPVAIKHVPQIDVKRTFILLNGRITWVPIEVAMLLKLGPRAAAETCAAVTLLDWYDVDYELILVLERPVPCMDLIDYISSKGFSLQEHEAKIIMKQLVDAIIEVHSRGVFHRDIKLDNILIETGSDVPRVRLIDFGCSTYLSEGSYSTRQGTYLYIGPECFLRGWYTAEPTTVWQLGVVLFGMLHENLPFKDSSEIIYGNPKVSENLSDDCQGFLLSCLVKSPEARPSLETLKHHPWLM